VVGARLAASLLLILVFRTGLGMGDWLLVLTSSASAATGQLDDTFSSQSMTPNLLEKAESPQVYMTNVIQVLQQGTLVLLQSSSRSVAVYQTDTNGSASCSLLPVE